VFSGVIMRTARKISQSGWLVGWELGSEKGPPSSPSLAAGRRRTKSASVPRRPGKPVASQGASGADAEPMLCSLGCYPASRPGLLRKRYYFFFCRKETSNTMPCFLLGW
jgi:hypothetical protein